MNRSNVVEKFKKYLGSSITIRQGVGFNPSAIRMNVSNDKKHGEHFTMTIHPNLKDEDVEFQVLDHDKDLCQMLVLLKYPRPVGRGNEMNFKKSNDPRNIVIERLLVGHDEMHWFVSGVTMSTTIREAFSNLRPEAATRAMAKAGVRKKDIMKRKNKGFIRQGEWFFVPVNFKEDSTTVIHKNEPIIRGSGSTPHYIQEVVRMGGSVVYVNLAGDIITKSQYEKLPSTSRVAWTQRMRGARVLGRGSVKHRDHHTIKLNGWHEVHLATEAGVSSNAFID